MTSISFNDPCKLLISFCLEFYAIIFISVNLITEVTCLFFFSLLSLSLLKQMMLSNLFIFKKCTNTEDSIFAQSYYLTWFLYWKSHFIMAFSFWRLVGATTFLAVSSLSLLLCFFQHYYFFPCDIVPTT